MELATRKAENEVLVGFMTQDEVLRERARRLSIECNAPTRVVGRYVEMWGEETGWLRAENRQRV